MMVAATDAMGSGTKFAIGGFIKLPTATIWFSECFQLADFAFAGIELSANASDNISCYECLARVSTFLLAEVTGCLLFLTS